MNILKLSELPTTIKRAEEIIDYMLDNGYSILINDLGSGIEYSVDDVLDSEEYLLEWVRLKGETSIIKKRSKL